jgi:hypothetical protein
MVLEDGGVLPPPPNLSQLVDRVSFKATNLFISATHGYP